MPVCRFAALVRKFAAVCRFAAILLVALPSAAAEPVSIAEKTAAMQRFDGFLPFYWDSASGKIWLQIDRFDQDLIYVNWLSRGLGSNPVGLDRAQLGDARMVRFERIGPKVLLKQPNLRYRALTDDPHERRAVEESFAQSVLWGTEIEAESNGAALVDATDFLLRDAHGVASRLKARGQGDFKLDPKRSAIVLERTKAFPQNSEFEAMLTFEGDRPGARVVETTPTPEAVTLHLHHSFVSAPPSGYRPRLHDPRSGSSSIVFADYATALDAPLETRWMRRHRLAKRDPGAAVSEPVEPIVYYLDPGAPEPVRSALLEGARWWNDAFDAAGYRNAFRVELLPEGADPLDVRYNVINWVHRSTRGWSYGGSVLDPRTGEIIKGVVTLGSLRVRQDRLLFEGLQPQFEVIASCAAAAGPAAEALAAVAGDFGPVDVSLARLRQLSAHEVGHTLGFSHNFASSSYGRESVMDYPAPLVEITPEGDLDLSQAYGVGIGEWDKIAVRYAYTDFPAGADEPAELDKIIREAIDKDLLFLSDADSRPLGAPHPLSSLWDNGPDPVAALGSAMQVRKIALEKFSAQSIDVGRPMSELALTLAPLYLHHRYQVEATAKTLGGFEFSYAVRGDGRTPVTLVPPERQRAALGALLETLSAEALTLTPRLLELLPPPAHGYAPSAEALPSRSGRAFDPLAAAAVAAKGTVDALLEPTRGARLEEFHARDASFPGLDEVITALLGATWLGAPESDPWRAAVRYEIDSVALDGLIQLAGANMASPAVRALVADRLSTLAPELRQRGAAAQDERWRYSEAASRIDRFLERPHVPAVEPASPDVPPGSPIGSQR